MKLLINMVTKKVVGIDKEKTPLTYIVEIPDINPTKTIKENVERQKANNEGKLLYLNENNEETTEKSTIVNNAIQYHKPLIEKVTISSTYSLKENPSIFNLSDIVKTKEQYVLQGSNFNNIILFEELSEENLNINLNSNSAHTGTKVIRLLPNGQCQTNAITLPDDKATPTGYSSIGIYLESDNGVSIEVGESPTSFRALSNNTISFSKPVYEVYVRFINTTINEKEVKAYGVLY